MMPVLKRLKLTCLAEGQAGCALETYCRKREAPYWSPGQPYLDIPCKINFSCSHDYFTHATLCTPTLRHHLEHLNSGESDLPHRLEYKT